MLLIVWISSDSLMYFETYLSDNVYGVAYRFIKTTKDVFIKKPENYSKEKVEEILSRYRIEKSDVSDKDKPNIIVIMNESLSDLNSVYNLEYKDNLSFINSLSNGTKLYSSVYAGSTANSEFEFLTGISTYFYKKNIPYQQYIKKNIYALPRIMKENGYTTSAMHLYNSASYNRDKIYKFMGFDKSIFDKDTYKLDVQKMLRCDKNVYKEIINMFENKNKDEKLFHFCVTLQNHMPYNVNFENYKKYSGEYKKIADEFEAIFPKDYYTEDEELNGYLNLIKLSDNSFKELTEFFENYDEKVIIMIFGDHQPRILENDELLKNYEVSYALWSNYEIEKPQIDYISINYLPVILSDLADIQEPEYFEFLKELRKELPVITANGYMDNNETWYSIDNKNEKYEKLLKEYNYLQYYYIYDNNIN